MEKHKRTYTSLELWNLISLATVTVFTVYIGFEDVIKTGQHKPIIELIIFFAIVLFILYNIGFHTFGEKFKKILVEKRYYMVYIQSLPLCGLAVFQIIRIIDEYYIGVLKFSVFISGIVFFMIPIIQSLTFVKLVSKHAETR